MTRSSCALLLSARSPLAAPTNGDVEDMDLALALSLSLAESSTPASASTSALGASERDAEEDLGSVKDVFVLHKNG